jgi:hypothetical protein
MADPTTTTPASAISAPPAAAPAAPAAAVTPAPVTPPASSSPASVLAAAEAPAAPADGAAPSAEAPKDAAPAPAALELKLPEGFTADEKAVSGFKELAQKSGLKAEAAQNLFDFYVGLQQQQAQADALAAQQDAEAQLTAAKADPDIGGKRWDESISLGRKAVERLAAQPVVKLLEERGLGNHPEVLKLFARLGKAVGEDSVAGTTPAAPAAPSSAEFLQSFYPTMHKQKSEP